MSEDWDESGTTTFGLSSAGGAKANSVGRGWGRGMGFSDSSDSTKKPGFGMTNGLSNGFSTNNNDEDDGWGESNKENTFGFGGGFGNSNDTPRGGGFGGTKSFGKSGGSGCRNCGEDGHFARECPNKKSGGGGGGDRSCYKCGETGHISRDCPSAGSGGGGGDRSCYKCGETGHISKDCPSAGSGGGGGDRSCYKCGESGHISRDCPSAGSGGGGGDRSCYKCGETGHISKDCPSAGSGGGSGGSGCRKCGEEGHFARDCPQGGGGGSKGCFNCGSEEHQKKDCPEPPKPRVGEDGKPLPELYIPPAPTEDETEMFRGVSEGINFAKYDDIPVEVTGRDKPGHIERFEDSGIYETCMNNIRKANYHKPTPIQKYAIPIILKGRDLMGCAQTGSGKTAAFLLPILTGMVRDGCCSSAFDTLSGTKKQTPECVVIAPTRELAIQIFNEARKFSHNSVIRPVVIYGGTSVGHQMRQVEQGTNILVATPGRLKDFLGRGVVSFAKCKYLVLDEADRMLDMGFGPEVRRLVEESDMPPKTERNTLMFSATFPEEIQRLAADFLNDYLFVTVGRVGGANTDVSQQVIQVDTYEKREKLCAIIGETGSDRTLVFVETKRNADFLASYLSQCGFPTTSVHGDRQQREREDALKDFRTGKAPILVATSVCARGLDIPEVKHVINYDLPSEIEDYVHRIGRTGRCGNIGKATSFFSGDSDGKVARQLVKILSDAQQEVPSWLESAAEGSIGTSGFTGMGGDFGGKDVRRGKGNRGGGGGGDDEWGNAGMSGGGFNSGFSAGGGGGFGGGATNEEEDWD